MLFALIATKEDATVPSFIDLLIEQFPTLPLKQKTMSLIFNFAPPSLLYFSLVIHLQEDTSKKVP